MEGESACTLNCSALKKNASGEGAEGNAVCNLTPGEGNLEIQAKTLKQRREMLHLILHLEGSLRSLAHPGLHRLHSHIIVS